jgi:6-pyruvoyltetrahydropterin/6-carboxytetrahydropterin synthase
MSLNGENQYCNPSVENIAKEIFLAMEVLFKKYDNLKIHKVTLYETPNCYTECIEESISEFERMNWLMTNEDGITFYREQKGYIEYDDRKL